MNISSSSDRAITVAMLIHNYLPTVGGAERQLNSLNPLFVEVGIDPVVYTRSRPGQPGTETLNGARVVRVPCFGPKPIKSLMFVFGTLWRLFRSKPDVVHAYDTLTPSLVAGIYSLVSGTPYLTKLLRSGELGDLNQLAEKPFGKARLTLLKRSVTKFVAISRDLETELDHQGISSDRMVFIPNGVDTERFRPPNLESAAGGSELGPQQRWDHRSDVFPDWPRGPVVAVVGRLSPEKRVVELARQWKRAADHQTDAWLYVVGEGQLSVELEGLDNVRFLGKREDMPEILRWCDVYVSASSAEGLSNALLEAMASGCPCVVTDVGGVRDVMVDGQDGRIVAPEGANRSADDIAMDVVDRVVELLDRPEDRRRLGGAAREAVVSRYSLLSTASSLAEEYTALGREKALN